MLIDWFTVGAQGLNFIILVWLMKRFLYQPILDAIDARERRIAAELSDADAKKAEAQQERDEFQQKNDQFDRQRAALLSKATEEASAEKLRLLSEAQQAVEALSAKHMETLKNDAFNLNQAISRQTQQEVFAIVRKTLAYLANTDLEERLSDVFIRRLQALDDDAKSSLAQALASTTEPALVRSAFELSAQQQAAIQTVLNEIFSANPSSPVQTDITTCFVTAPDVISGIELSANGWKIAWSIAEYIADLEKNISERLNEQLNCQAKSNAKPVAYENDK